MTRKKPTTRALAGLGAALVSLAACQPAATPETPADELARSADAITLPAPTLLKDLITTGTTAAASNAQNFFAFGNKLFFSATSAPFGSEPWITDGTAAGTTLLADINPGGKDSLLKPYWLLNGKLIFNAIDGAHGSELWVTDGTPAGTQILKDIYPGSKDSVVVGGVNGTNLLPGVVLFMADDGVHGTELWKTDGTPAGTAMLKEIAPGAAGAKGATGFTLFNGKVYFSVDDSVNGAEPWVTDGTELGTKMLADMRPGNLSSTPRSFTPYNGKLYFVAVDLLETGTNSGAELAVTDGTPEGTQYIEVNPTGPSYANVLTLAAGRLFFTAAIPDAPPLTKDLELWSTDGAVTAKVKDINAGDASAKPGTLTPFGSKLFFYADNGTTGAEPWVTDGTTAGTTLLADINAGTATSNSFGTPIVLNGKVYFTATDGTTAGVGHGTEWWMTDGTPAGTVILADINPGTGSSSPGTPTLVGSTLFFTASDGTTGTAHGTELWKTDGTAAGTVLLADATPGTGSGSPTSFAVLNGKLYFSASSGTTAPATGREPWVSDGTPAGTVQLADLNVGTGSSSPASFTAVNGNLLMTGDNGTGAEIFLVPGFTGTPAFVDINPLLQSSFTSTAEQFTALGSKLVFVMANDTTVGSELFVSDGTSAGTGILTDLNPGTSGASPNYLTVMNDTLYFAGTGKVGANSTGTELWKTDGTAANTVLVKDIQTGTGGGNPANMTVVGSNLFFSAVDGFSAPASGQELWMSDGSTGGTVMVKDINPGTSGSNPGNLAVFGNQVFFTASEPVGGVEPWMSDGTAAGTRQLLDLVPGAAGTGVTKGVELDGWLYFAANDGGVPGGNPYGYELWRTNGTTTAIVKDIRPNGLDALASTTQLVVLGHQLVFAATTDTEGNELWITDGTAAGTRLLKDIYPGVGSSTPTELTEVYGVVYFAAVDAAGGRELWKTDGTTAGTVRVKDINPGFGSSLPVNLARFGNMLLFGASDGVNGRELWQTDGTAAGTIMLGDLWAGAGSSEPGKAVQVGNRAYFLATTPANGREIFSVDLPTPDTTKPFILCPPNVTATTDVNAPGAQSYPAARAYDDLASAPTITYDKASGSSFPIGPKTVTATATDAAGNTATCTFTVTRQYIDKVVPEITCPDDKAVVSHRTSGISVDFAAEATDDFTVSPAITYDHDPNTNFVVGVTHVTATAKDEAGNKATCGFDVTVTFEDNSPPTMTCPADVLVTTHTNVPAAAVFALATATDDAPGEIAITHTSQPGALYPVGSTLVTATGTDLAGNSGSCSFHVNVVFEDIAAPVITCPDTKLVDSPFAEGIAVTWDAATGVDADSGLAPAITYSIANGSVLPIGDTTVTATATDGAGHTDSCTFHVQVTLVDTTAPVIHCPGDQAAGATEREGVVVEYPAATATDNLEPAPTIGYDHASGTRFPLGPTVVTATATDGFQNHAACSFTVTVTLHDDTKPVVTCPPDQTATAHATAGVEVTYPAATATDNLTTSPAITYDHASGTLFPVGETTVNVAAKDEFENVATCSFKVTVALVDIAKPTLVCPKDVAATATEEAGAKVTWEAATATDDIDTSVPVTYQPANGSMFAVGTATVTASATDKAGNAAQCTFKVVVAEGGGCGCAVADPVSFFAFAGLAAVLRRRKGKGSV